DADEIFVLMDNDRYPAKIIGADPSTDLAVIKIDVPDKPLSVIALGNSDELEVGEWVMAVGNPFSIWLQHSVTAGIVSGKGRVNVGIREIEYQDFIQTDAAINPGNSGGALVNLRGELVGINTAIYSNGFNGGNVGIGFAIPVNLVKYVSKELIENGKVVRGWLGVEIRPLDKETAESLGLTRTEGALVSGLQKGPARKAGIKPNDVIIEFAGIKVKDHNHLMHLVAVHKPGETVSLKVIHKGEVKQMSVKLGERPEREALATKETPNRPELGIEVETLTQDLAFRFDLKEKEGVVVVRVEPGSQAEDEGISPGDVIVAVNKVKVRSTEEFFRQIEKAQRKGVVLLRLSRRGSKYFVALDLSR
ncbi:MAG: PDZ domain-containing protein, partial [Calditrichaeota bacterium]